VWWVEAETHSFIHLLSLWSKCGASGSRRSTSNERISGYLCVTVRYAIMRIIASGTMCMMSAVLYSAPWGTNECWYSRSRLFVVPVRAKCRWKREHWWNDTGPGHCTTNRQSVIQLVLGSSPSWCSWPDFSQSTEYCCLPVVGRPVGRMCGVCPLRWVTAFVGCVYLHTRITSHTEISDLREYLNVSYW
jgi:hypothetical protein